MNPSHIARPLKKMGTFAAALLAALLAPAAFAFDSGSTGADGILNPQVNTEIQLPESGILNYASIDIPQGVTVKFKRNTLNTPVYLLVSGNATIRGVIDIRGEDAKDAGTYGDGNLADDGVPGRGGPGGFDGGRGGRDDQSMRAEIIRGGSGLGPGGGKGGIEGADGCSLNRYYKYVGMGASYATFGSNSYYYFNYCGNIPATGTPDQAAPYGSPLLQPLLGGSGGGGGRGSPNYAGSGGGGGGGAILIAASGTITLAGSIDATGGDAGGSAGSNSGGTGAGGSGGAIRLVATTITGAGTLLANGGCRHNNGARRQDCLSTNDYRNPGGSYGRIRLEGEAITYSGTSQPTYVGDTPGPVFLASVPGLRIASVAGVNAPASPTGSADIVLPATVQNPVTVNLETTNVPTGNTVIVKVIPAYGNTTEVQSPAIAGSTANGNTSVQVALPQGPSVLQATTTYTVVVAQGEALSRYANNERVEKVELTATLGGIGGNQVKLITISGKEFVVPAAVLQLAGISG